MKKTKIHILHFILLYFIVNCLIKNSRPLTKGFVAFQLKNWVSANLELFFWRGSNLMIFFSHLCPNRISSSGRCLFINTLKNSSSDYGYYRRGWGLNYHPQHPVVSNYRKFWYDFPSSYKDVSTFWHIAW